MNSLVASARSRVLSNFERQLEGLAMLPGVVAKVALLEPDQEGFSEAMEDLASKDPPLAFRLLRAANSLLVESQAPALTIGEALVRIGSRRLASMVTSLSVVRVFVASTQKQRGLWTHSHQVAMASQRIAEEYPDYGVDPRDAYLAGLVHDIGRFILLDEAPHESAMLHERVWVGGMDLVEAESEFCGINHAELGFLACEMWSIPDALAQMVRLHHTSAPDPKTDSEVTSMLRVVQAADGLSFAMQEAAPADPKNRRSAIQTELERLGHEICFVDARFLEEEWDRIEAGSAEMARALLLSL